MRPLTRKNSKLLLSAVCAALVLGATSTASAAPVRLDIKIIYAHSKSKTIDPKLKALSKQLSKLAFTAYELKDQTTVTLEIGSSTQFQLPNEQWMKVLASELTKDGKLRIEFSIEKPKFKTTASIAHGATLAVGGPQYEAGSLILAVTRPK